MSTRAQGVGVTPSFDMETRAPHRAWKDAALAIPGRHRALSMDPEIVPTVLLERYVVVIGRDGGVPADPSAQHGFENTADVRRHGPSTCVGEAPRPRCVVEIRDAGIAPCV